MINALDPEPTQAHMGIGMEAMLRRLQEYMRGAGYTGSLEGLFRALTMAGKNRGAGEDSGLGGLGDDTGTTSGRGGPSTSSSGSTEMP